MGESFIQREFLTPRKLAFNVIWYGVHLFLFAYGWWSQVRFFRYRLFCLRSTID